MDYSGEIMFISDTGASALVLQTSTGATYAEGYRRLVADFSIRTVGEAISYDYTTDTSAECDEVTYIA